MHRRNFAATLAAAMVLGMREVIPAGAVERLRVQEGGPALEKVVGRTFRSVGRQFGRVSRRYSGSTYSHFGARQYHRHQVHGFHTPRFMQKYEIELLARDTPGWRVMRVAELGYETPRDLMRTHQHQRVLDYFRIRFAAIGGL